MQALLPGDAATFTHQLAFSPVFSMVGAKQLDEHFRRWLCSVVHLHNFKQKLLLQMQEPYSSTKTLWLFFYLDEILENGSKQETLHLSC